MARNNAIQEVLYSASRKNNPTKEEKELIRALGRDCDTLQESIHNGLNAIGELMLTVGIYAQNVDSTIRNPDEGALDNEVLVELGDFIKAQVYILRSMETPIFSADQLLEKHRG